MMQPSLLEWTPPVILGDRDGETFDRPRDLSRLNAQARDVFHYMKHGEWRTLADISANTGHPEASVSARLRDLRKPTLGGMTVERRYIARGLYQYRVVI
jgi:hypothetical protein